MTTLAAVAVGVAVAMSVLALIAPPSFAVVRPVSLLARWSAASAERRASMTALGVLRSTHAGLRSGLPLVPALRAALMATDADARGPFEEVLRSFELNTPLADAVASVRARHHDARLAMALEALRLVAAEQLPSARSAAVIASVAERLAFLERTQEEIAARTSGLRAQVVALALLVPALALYLGITMPGLGATLASPLGVHVLVPAAFVFEVAGIVASRAAIRVTS